MLVEHQLLRVAQSAMHHFELGAIRVRAEHRALVGKRDASAFLARHVHAAIADGEVQLAVVAHRQAVEIVAGEVVAHTEAAQQLGLLHVAGVAFQQPQAGNVGEPDLAVAREHARGDAVELAVEAVRVDAALVGHAVVVRVFDQADDLTFDGEVLGLLAEHLAMQGGAILDGARGEIQFQHSHVVADIEHAGAITIRLRHEQPSLLVKVDGYGIRQHGLGGPQRGLQSLGQRESRQRQFGVIRSRVDDRRRQPLDGFELQGL